MKHRDPYRIKDPNDIWDVTENSSHAELKDSKRRWYFGGYSFNTATEAQKFFANEGLRASDYKMDPRPYWDGAYKRIDIYIIPKHQRGKSRAG